MPNASSNTTLFAGPYFGEFGHELLGTGLLRARAQHYDRVIVCSRPARAALYADIATEFRPHDIQCIGQSDHATEATQPSPKKIQSYVEPGCDKFLPPDCGRPQTELRLLPEGIYHPLGKKRAEWNGVVAFHARNRSHQTERNWPMDRWEALAQWIKGEGIATRVVCVGTREEARLVSGCCDMRGSPLGTQLDIAASALCAVGPSSGWMHLASLCKCPHLTWVGGQPHVYVRRRYVDRWNPLRTRVAVIPERTWQPSFDTVRSALATFLGTAA